MAGTLKIYGGRQLFGAVDVPAAKNSVLPLLAACILCEKPVLLHGVPRLSDVDCCLEILNTLGLEAQRAGRSVRMLPHPLQTDTLPAEQVGRMRASVLFTAPVLAKTGRVVTGMPGGCRLGTRPIDIHLDGLIQMGAAVDWNDKRLVVQAPHGLRGADYTLRFPSVGATETLLMAAVTAKGRTTLRGAACEPEIRDLAAFLSLCGAEIRGAGSPVITVQGHARLGGAEFTPLPDRIVAATLACAVASAGGEGVLCRCDPFALSPLLGALKNAGCRVELSGRDEVTVARRGTLHGIGRIFTGVYPAFATDMAPLLAAALLTGDSESSIEDIVFENRFSCAEGFAAMGAKVKVRGRMLEVCPAALRGAAVTAHDLRGGAALAIAALAAPQMTQIDGAAHIRRGYEDLPGMLRRMGAAAFEK